MAVPAIKLPDGFVLDKPINLPAGFVLDTPKQSAILPQPTETDRLRQLDSQQSAQADAAWFGNTGQNQAGTIQATKPTTGFLNKTKEFFTGTPEQAPLARDPQSLFREYVADPIGRTYLGFMKGAFANSPELANAFLQKYAGDGYAKQLKGKNFDEVIDELSATNRSGFERLLSDIGYYTGALAGKGSVVLPKSATLLDKAFREAIRFGGVEATRQGTNLLSENINPEIKTEYGGMGAVATAAGAGAFFSALGQGANRFLQSQAGQKLVSKYPKITDKLMSNPDETTVKEVYNVAVSEGLAEKVDEKTLQAMSRHVARRMAENPKPDIVMAKPPAQAPRLRPGVTIDEPVDNIFKALPQTATPPTQKPPKVSVKPDTTIPARGRFIRTPDGIMYPDGRRIITPITPEIEAATKLVTARRTIDVMVPKMLDGVKSAKLSAERIVAKYPELESYFKNVYYDNLVERANANDKTAIKQLNEMNPVLETYDSLLSKAEQGDATAIEKIQQGQYQQPAQPKRLSDVLPKTNAAESAQVGGPLPTKADVQGMAPSVAMTGNRTAAPVTAPVKSFSSPSSDAGPGASLPAQSIPIKGKQAIEFTDESLGSSHDQRDGRYYAKNEKGEYIGRIDYAEYDDEILIKYIEVEPEYRRKGVGTALYENLKKEYPEYEVKPYGDVYSESGRAFSIKNKLIEAESLSPLTPSPAPDLKVIRFEAGKALTKEQKKEVLKSIGDTYRESGIKKTELKGQDINGDPKYGYPYSPETFRKSDITGKKIRHYILLPDGRIAHPTELFPNLKQAEIDKAILEVEYAEKQKQARKDELLSIANKAESLNEANRIAAQRGYAKLPNYAKDSIVLQKDNHFIRVMKGNEDVELLESEGFKVIIREGNELQESPSSPSPSATGKGGEVAVTAKKQRNTGSNRRKQGGFLNLQGPVETAKKAGEFIKKHKEGFYQDWFNRFHSIENLTKKAIALGARIKPGENPTMRAREYLGIGKKVESVLKYNTFRVKPDGSIEKTGEGLKPILDDFEAETFGLANPKVLKKDLDNFLIAMRTIHDLQRPKTPGSTENIVTPQQVAQANAELRRLVNKYGQNINQFDATATRLYDYQKRVLHGLVDSGIMSQDMYDGIIKQNPHYIPFDRVIEDVENSGGTPISKGRFNRVRSPIKKIKGSEKEIHSTIESVIKNTYQIMDRAERNTVAKSIAKLQTILPDDISPVNIQVHPLAHPKGNVIEYYEDGKRKFIEVSKNVYRAMTGLTEESAGLLVRILAAPTNLLRQGATLTPEFISRNIIRDQFSAMMNTTHGFIPLVDSAGAIADIIGKSDVYKEWLASGAAYSGFVELSRPALTRAYKELMKNPSLLSRMNIITAAKDLSQLLEQATRVGAYKAAKRKGLSAVEAGYESREATVDFGRVGAKMKGVSPIVAFLNAGIQGSERTFRAGINNPVSFLIKGVTAITIPSIILYLLNRDDPEYKEIPAWQKDLFWIFKADEKWWRIPKPFIVGQIFGSLPEQFMSYLNDKDATALDKLKQSILSVMGSASPISGDPASGLLPTAIKPIIEIMTNHNFFTDGPIVQQSKQDLLPAEQYGRNTSESAKLAGKALDTSPAKIEHLMKGYLGGSAEYILDTSDMMVNAIRKAAGKPVPQKAPTEPSDIPLVKGFAVRTGGSAESVQKFYDSADKLNSYYMTYRSLRKQNRDAEATKLMKDHPELKRAPLFNKAVEKMSNYSKQIDTVITSETMSTEQKRAKIKQIEQDRLAFAQRMNKEINK